MSTWMIALLLKPLMLFAFFVLIVAPIEWLILKVVPQGKLRNLLTKKIS